MLAEYEFVSILKQNIRPAQPIDVPELPIHRDIRRTLRSPGMHVFVHGERGIGKTSIALTAAKAYLQTVGFWPSWTSCNVRFCAAVRGLWRKTRTCPEVELRYELWQRSLASRLPAKPLGARSARISSSRGDASNGN